METHVVITPGQARYLFCGPTAVGLEVERDNLAITAIDPEEGWIFVERQDCVGEPGSGLWVDQRGCEHYGPGENPRPCKPQEVLEAVKQWAAT